MNGGGSAGGADGGRRERKNRDDGGVADESAATPPVSKLVQQNCLEIGKQGEVWRGTPLHDRSAGPALPVRGAEMSAACGGKSESKAW